MCGRFYLDASPEQLARQFALTRVPALEPRYNIAPSQPIPAVRQAADGRELVSLRWGLIPAWAKSEKTGYHMINARAESVAVKPAYRAAFRHRRCLIPASGFYEWQAGPHGKQPFCICPADDGLFAFAGLWEHWEGQDAAGRVVESCTIVVTQANALLRPIHERMPVIVAPSDYAAWMDPALTDPAVLEPLLRPKPATRMRAYPVSRRVNDPHHDDPANIAPLSSPDQA